MIGGGIGGAFAGIFGFRMYMIASSSAIGIPAMFGDRGVFNVVIGIAAMVIAFICGFIATFILAKKGIQGPEFKKNK